MRGFLDASRSSIRAALPMIVIVGTVAFCFWYGTWVKAVIESGSWLLFGLLFLAPFVAVLFHR